MALVECVECGGQVSTRADACPKCGAVMPQGVVDTSVAVLAVLVLKILPMVAVGAVAVVGLRAWTREPARPASHADDSRVVLPETQRHAWGKILRDDHLPCDEISKVWTHRKTPEGESYRIACTNGGPYVFVPFANGNHYARKMSVLEE